jgi:site-specific DNA-cytosine methylase
MPKLLDLFSGTGSVSKTAQNRGWETKTLDKDLPADFKTNILEWDYKNFPENYFDLIHASPPCTHYSVARTTAKTPRDIEGSNNLVLKTLEIIDYFKPKYFIIENPQTGLLKKQEIVQDIPFTDIDYCKNGMPYRKRTRLWNNLHGKWVPRPLCCKDCGNIVDGSHLETAQRLPNKGEMNTGRKQIQQELYRIPTELINEILENVENNLDV